MPIKREVTNIWKNIQEIDLRPIQEAALSEFKLALVGSEAVGKRTLANELRSDPDRPQMATAAPVIIATMDIAESADLADAVILLVDANAPDLAAEQNLINHWRAVGKPVLVFYTKIDQLPEKGAVVHWLETGPYPKIYGSLLNRGFLLGEFSDALLDLLPDHLLALGRRFPLLRVPVANRLISETCMANATYALGTGLAEVIPVLGLPLNVADIIILTKAQALLVYKLGLALGMRTDWQYYVGELGGVIGGSFLWRQIARQLIGLVPVWGIIPKIGVAYSGTYVVGHAVLQWYLTGRHIQNKQLRALSQQAFTQGKELARRLVDSLSPKQLPRPQLPALPRWKPKALAAKSTPVCQTCSTTNDPDAKFCKNCGAPLSTTGGEVIDVDIQ